MVAIHRVKPVLLLNKPIYIGFSVLELSKLLMYDRQYNYFVKNFDCSLLFTDTDSLVYEIRSVDDIYEKIYEDRDSSDFSSDSNKKVIGKMKDEIGGIVISGFIGLKSKMYSLIRVDVEEKIRATGINRELKYDEFRDVLFNKKIIRYNIKRIQAKRNRLGAYDVCKISLSCFDDKR